jgi:hypothetical protein
MTSLLSLPVELQDEIIIQVSLDKRSPPATIEAAQQTRMKADDLPKSGVRGFKCWPEGPIGVRYE